MKNIITLKVQLKNKGFRLKNRDKTRNYFVEKINQNELVSKKHKRFV